jgi:hypothetical protein
MPERAGASLTAHLRGRRLHSLRRVNDDPDTVPPRAADTGSGPRRPAGTARVLAVLRLVSVNRQLSRLLAAFLAMTIVEYGQWITILLYAYKRDGATAAGLVALAQLIPSILLAPMIGAHGSRMGVARLLVACYVVSTLMLGACGVTILLGGPPLVVYACAVLFTLPLGVSIPLHGVLTPLVVRHPDELTAANVATGWCKGAGALAGPLLAGLMIGIGGTGLACVVLAGLAACAPVLARVRPLRTAAEDEEPGWRDLIAAARTIAGRSNTRVLMAYRAGSAAIEGAIDLLVVLLAIRVLVIGPAAAGYLSAAFGVGGLVGASAGVLLVGRHLARPLAGAALLGAAALAALTLASTTAVAVLLLIAVGAFRAVQSISAQTLLQRSTPLDVIVCAFVLIESVRDAGLAFGSLAVPVLLVIGGTDAAFLGMAAIALVIVLATLRQLRTMDRQADIPVVEMGVLRNIEIFSALPAAPLETLARESSYVTVDAGVPVIVEGTEGDRYYAVTGGEVVVTQGGREIRRMGAGEGFGELALLYPVRRSASVIPSRESTLLVMERAAFLATLHASIHVRAAADQVASRFLAEAR